MTLGFWIQLNLGNPLHPSNTPQTIVLRVLILRHRAFHTYPARQLYSSLEILRFSIQSWRLVLVTRLNCYSSTENRIVIGVFLDLIIVGAWAVGGTCTAQSIWLTLLRGLIGILKTNCAFHFHNVPDISDCCMSGLSRRLHIDATSSTEP